LDRTTRLCRRPAGIPDADDLLRLAIALRSTPGALLIAARRVPVTELAAAQTRGLGQLSEEEMIFTKDEPEVRRAKAKRYVASCNAAVHDAPWVAGDTSTRGGLFIALELAEQAYQAHSLRYEPGLPKMHLYDPRRVTWVYDESGEAENCVKLRDNNTGRLVIWPWF
jgi:hypothetical protein